MLIHDLPTSITAVASPGQTRVDFPFAGFAAAYVRVLVDGIETTYAVAPAVVTQHSVTLTGDEGGYITLGAPGLVAGQKIVVFRDLPIERITQFADAGPVAMTAINAEFNREVALIQQVSDGQARSITVPIGEAGFVLPPASSRPNKFLAFDPTGAPLYSTGTGGDGLRADLGASTGGTLVKLGTGDSVQSALTRVLGTGPIVLVVAGQSNALGAYRSANPAHNPASPNVKVWDNVVGAWGSSNLDSVPMSRASPGGSSTHNNYGVAAAHYLHERTGRPVYMILDATGGTSIDAWTAAGVASLRYDALRNTVAAALAALPGKTTIDLMIWAQGEEDALLNTFQMHVDKLGILNAQLRAESWMTFTTPVFAMGMSGLHDRYPPDKAIRHYTGKVNLNWVFISMKGLPTNYDLTGAPDYTHFTGESLWAGGYERVGPAYLENQRGKDIPVMPFWSRGGGELNQNDQTAISTFSHLVSWESRDRTSSAINAHAADGSIAWGEQCVADGNYTFCFGWECVTDNAANWTLLAGRELTASAAGDFAGAFGYQNAVNNTYTFASGRNNIVASSGAAAFGTFSAVTTDLADPAMFQVGVGTSSVARSNALTVYKSGIVDAKLQLNVAGTKVLGARGAAVADATDAASVITQLNLLLARCRAHGLIA